MIKLNKIVLTKNESFEFIIKGMLIYVEVDREKAIFRLKSTVFSENNFIPLSIRECVNNLFEASFSKKNPTYLQIDKPASRVDLIQEFYGEINIPVIKLVRLFSFLARSWASILKRIAKQDLLNS